MRKGEFRRFMNQLKSIRYYELKKFIKWTFLFLWLSFIFYMSNQTGTTSSGMSDGIFHSMCKILPILENGKEIVIVLIRKSAHVLEYVILGVLTLEVVKEYTNDIKKTTIISLLLCLLFALLDEFHQLFLVGRAGKITDVLIDSIGYVSAICFFYFLRKNK